MNRNQPRREENEGLPQRLAGSLWVERLAKLGYAAKGLLYVIAGCTLALAATGFGGRPVGLRGALRFVIAQPFGRVAVGLVALGLAGFILRRMVQVFVSPEGQPKLSDAYFAAPRLLPERARECRRRVDGPPTRARLDRAESSRSCLTLDWTVLLVATPYGGWLVVGVGLAIVGFAGFHLYIAVTVRFQIDLQVKRMSTRVRKLTFACGRGGYAALGIALSISGGTVAYAGWLADTREVIGVGAALQSLERSHSGTVLFVAVATGAMGHGLYLVFVVRSLRLIAAW